MNERSKAYSRTWRPSPQLPSGGDKSMRRLRVAVVAAALLVVSGALLAWLLFVRPFHQAHFLPLCIGEYGEEFPIRGWVRQDGETLRSLGWEETNTFTSQQRELLQSELRKLAGCKFEGPLVVYLSAYARATAEGELCLLPVDARLDRPDTWLPLREVFKSLHDVKSQHKLLLLDIMQPFIDARRGLLVNDSTEYLQPLLDEAVANDRRLSVLCACSQGQVSLVAEELGHSVFAYFLCKGLRGQADGENARHSRDGRVSLSELAGYVTAQVEQWALRQRGVRQSPWLFGATDDYPLVVADPSEVCLEEPPLPAEYPDWLSTGWKQRDNWLDEENSRLIGALAQHRSPLLALRADLENALLRAEQQWRGGLSAERVRQELAARRERLERRRVERLPFTAAPSQSLAKATAGGRKPPELSDVETIKAVTQLAARYAHANRSKPDAEELNKLKTESNQLLKKFEGKPLALAWDVFAASDADIPTREVLGFLSGLLKQAQSPEYVETGLLTRLAEIPAATPDDWPAEGVQLALRMVWEAEKSACAYPRAFAWVSEVRSGADRLRQQGEMLLFAEGPAPRRRAADSLRDALKAYQAINRDLDSIEEAQRCSEEMQVQLASYLPYLEVDGATASAWQNALTTAYKLRQVLAEPEVQPGDARDAKIHKLMKLTAALRNDPDNLNRLRRPLDRQQFDQLIGQRQVGNPADGKIMTALLETPWPPAEQRAKLWSARHELFGALQRRRAEANLPPGVESPSLEVELRQGLLRAQRSLAVFRLLGSDKVEKVEKALAHAEAKPADASRLRTVAEALRQAWMRQ
jgi:hypothetical protein